MNKSVRYTLLTAAVMSIFTVTRSVAAQPSGANKSPAGAKKDANIQVATALFKDGLALYEAGNYEAALAKFEASIAEYPSRSALRNLAYVHQKLGDILQSKRDFDRLLELFPSMPKAERDLVSLERERVLELIGTLEIVGLDGDGVTLELNGKPQEALPKGAVDMRAGAYVVSAHKPGFKDFRSETKVVGKESTVLKVVFEPLPKDDPGAVAIAPLAQPKTGLAPTKVAALITGGAALASLGVSLVFVASRSGTASDMTTAGCNGGVPTATFNRCKDLQSSGESQGTLATIFGVGAGALGATALVLLILPGKASTAEKHATVCAPSVGPTGAFAMCSGTF